MNEIIELLRKIGLPEEEIKNVQARYKDDIDGLSEFALYMRAILDDRHEYLD